MRLGSVIGLIVAGIALGPYRECRWTGDPGAHRLDHDSASNCNRFDQGDSFVHAGAFFGFECSGALEHALKRRRRGPRIACGGAQRNPRHVVLASRGGLQRSILAFLST